MIESHKKLKKEPGSNKSIALIGHMGSGKSHIGKLIANNLKFKHIDSDKIKKKREKTSIKEIFITKGESAFRQIEEEIIISFKEEKNIVLSLGGGSILSKKIRNLLKKNFITLFLDIDINIIVERLKSSHKRPLLLNANIKQKIKQLDIKRRKYYTKANIIINNQNKAEMIVSEFLEKYNYLLLNE